MNGHAYLTRLLARPRFVYRPRSYEQVARHLRQGRFFDDCIIPAYAGNVGPLFDYLRSEPLTDQQREALLTWLKAWTEKRPQGTHRKPAPSRTVTKADAMRLVRGKLELIRRQPGNNGRVPHGGRELVVDDVLMWLGLQAEAGELEVDDAVTREALIAALPRRRPKRKALAS